MNRPLLEEFARLMAGSEWDVALLQEAPPRWFRPLAQRLGASGALALTSRNFLPPLQRRLADWNPDLIASSEGGSNQLLVRGPHRGRPRLMLTRRPERRRMLWARLALPQGRLCVANLHASAGLPDKAAVEVERAADRAVEWAEGEPLVFGGDFNLRPRRQPEPFARLASASASPRPPTPGRSITCSYAGAEVVEAPAPPATRGARADRAGRAPPAPGRPRPRGRGLWRRPA